MANYSFYCCDLVTNKLIAILPFTQVDFETVLNDAGSFEAYLPLSDPKVQASNWDAATVPARSVIYVLRNDQPVWGGIMWTRDYDSEKDKKVEHFQASTFESYYEHIPYVATTVWTGRDQLEIIREIIASVNASGYTLPMPVSGNSSGVLIDYTTLASDYKWVGDIFSELQELPNGFDFNVDVYYTPTTGPYKQMNLGYPTRGYIPSDTPYVFEYPGNVWYYKWSEDGSAYASDVIETGAGSGPTMPVGLAGDPWLLADGWPIMYAIVSRKDITDQTSLDAYATGDLALYNQPSILAEFHVRADMDPELGTYSVGDAVRVRILDDRFPNGADGFLRIQSIKVTVSDDGNEDVAVTAVGTVYA